MNNEVKNKRKTKEEVAALREGSCEIVTNEMVGYLQKYANFLAHKIAMKSSLKDIEDTASSLMCKVMRMVYMFDESKGVKLEVFLKNGMFLCYQTILKQHYKRLEKEQLLADPDLMATFDSETGEAVEIGKSYQDDMDRQAQIHLLEDFLARISPKIEVEVKENDTLFDKLKRLIKSPKWEDLKFDTVADRLLAQECMAIVSV